MENIFELLLMQYKLIFLNQIDQTHFGDSGSLTNLPLRYHCVRTDLKDPSYLMLQRRNHKP